MSENLKICSFCGKPENRVSYMFSSDESVANICGECIQYCYDIMLYVENKDSKKKSDRKVGCIDD